MLDAQQKTTRQAALEEQKLRQKLHSEAADVKQAAQTSEIGLKATAAAAHRNLHIRLQHTDLKLNDEPVGTELTRQLGRRAARQVARDVGVPVEHHHIKVPTAAGYIQGTMSPTRGATNQKAAKLKQTMPYAPPAQQWSQRILRTIARREAAVTAALKRQSQLLHAQAQPSKEAVTPASSAAGSQAISTHELADSTGQEHDPFGALADSLTHDTTTPEQAVVRFMAKPQAAWGTLERRWKVRAQRAHEKAQNLKHKIQREDQEAEHLKSKLRALHGTNSSAVNASQAIGSQANATQANAVQGAAPGRQDKTTQEPHRRSQEVSRRHHSENSSSSSGSNKTSGRIPPSSSSSGSNKNHTKSSTSSSNSTVPTELFDWNQIKAKLRDAVNKSESTTKTLEAKLRKSNNITLPPQNAASKLLSGVKKLAQMKKQKKSTMESNMQKGQLGQKRKRAEEKTKKATIKKKLATNRKKVAAIKAGKAAKKKHLAANKIESIAQKQEKMNKKKKAVPKRPTSQGKRQQGATKKRKTAQTTTGNKGRAPVPVKKANHLAPSMSLPPKVRGAAVAPDPGLVNDVVHDFKSDEQQKINKAVGSAVGRFIHKSIPRWARGASEVRKLFGNLRKSAALSSQDIDATVPES